MILYPAIDLRAGVCVRLMHGRFDRVTEYDTDPSARLAAFAEAGAGWVHIVDLDGAQAGRAVQHELIGALAKRSGAKIQSGGGVRTFEDVEALLAAGVSRVVIGSLATTSPGLVCAWLDQFGPDRLTIALDVRADGDTYRPSLKGWTEAAAFDLWTVLSCYPTDLLRHVLITDVGRDGALTGPNLDLLGEVRRRRPELKVQASGGMSSLQDLVAARTIGCDGAIVGRAIYEGRFTVRDAIEAVQ